MKPYVQLAENTDSVDLSYGLYERDGVRYYQVNSDPIASSKEINCEYELAHMMARPFKPAKQPRVLVIGLGLGSFLNAIAESMPQEKAQFDVLDLNKDSFSWYKKFLAEEKSTAPRVEFAVDEVSSFVRSKAGVYNALFLDPELWRSSKNGEDLTSKPYLNYFVNALKMGGLLGMVTERPDKIVEGRMERCGFEVTVERIAAVPGGKRQRTIWLAKKGHYQRAH